jgi:gas vesicle protein
MNNESRTRSTHVGIWSALAGGAVGFALGMVFAPKRGPDTRRQLAYQLERTIGQVNALVRRFSATSVDSEARRTRDALVADAQARADHIRDDIDALLDELRQKSSAPESSSPASPSSADDE